MLITVDRDFQTEKKRFFFKDLFVFFYINESHVAAKKATNYISFNNNKNRTNKRTLSLQL